MVGFLPHLQSIPSLTPISFSLAEFLNHGNLFFYFNGESFHVLKNTAGKISQQQACEAKESVSFKFTDFF
jgi:hypothetical protein